MLEDLKNLVDAHRELLLTINKLDAELKELKNKLSDIEEIEIPVLLDRLDMPQVKFNDGTIVNLNERLFTKIKSSNKDAAFDWLRENGHSEIIKTTENVHHATMDSLGRELIEEGINLPSELFDQYLRRIAKISHGEK